MLTKACPVCGGDVYSELVDFGVIEYRCFQAGHLVSENHINKVIAGRKYQKEVTVVNPEEKKTPGSRARISLERRIKEFEKDREQVLADYADMRLNDFYSKWHLNSTLWGHMKKLWEVKGKRPGYGQGEPVEKSANKKPEGTAPLTEHEQYLILLGYQQAVREILKYF